MSAAGDQVRRIVAAAGLSVQHRCHGCKRPLEAFGRSSEELWSCAPCAVPGATVADVYDPRGAS